MSHEAKKTEHCGPKRGIGALPHKSHQSTAGSSHTHNPGRFAASTCPTAAPAPSTNMVTHLRQQFYPKLDPGKVDWFDVIPPRTYSAVDKLSISAVSLQHSNGVYSSPSCSKGDAPPDDWTAFVTATIERGQKARSTQVAIQQPPQG